MRHVLPPFDKECIADPLRTWSKHDTGVVTLDCVGVKSFMPNSGTAMWGMSLHDRCGNMIARAFKKCTLKQRGLCFLATHEHMHMTYLLDPKKV